MYGVAPALKVNLSAPAYGCNVVIKSKVFWIKRVGLARWTRIESRRSASQMPFTLASYAFIGILED